MKNTLTTTSARRTPGLQARRRDSRLLPSTRSTTSAERRTSSSLMFSTPSVAMALRTSSYLPCRSSQRGDSGMRERITSPIRAGTAPRPSTSRQPDEAALAGQRAKMISAMM